MIDKRRILPFVLVALVALAASVSAAAPPQQTLVFKFEAGDELVFEQVMTQDIEMQGMGSVGGNEIISTMSWKVLEVADDGNATIEVTNDRVRGTTSTPMGTTTFDSASEETSTDPMARMMAAQAGIAFGFVMAPSGEIVSVEFSEAMKEAALAEMSEEERAAVGSMFDEFLTDEAMENMLKQGFMSFPTEPVGPGDSWDRSMSMKLPMIGTLVTSMTMTLDRFEERGGTTVAVLPWTGSMELIPDPSSSFPGTLDMSSSVMTGTQEFDVDRGRILSNNMSALMQMAMAAAGQEMIMDMTMKMEFKLVEGGN